MARIYTNFAYSTLASGIAPATTSLTLDAGDGALFPAAGAGSTFDAVIYNTSLQREIVSCTSRTGDVLTITRAQQGTSALTWNAGDRIGHRLTAGALNNIMFADDLQENTATWCGTAGGTANALTLTPSPAVTVMAAGHKFIFKSGAAANTTAVTMAVSGLATFALQSNGVALVPGAIEANKWYEVLYDGTNGQLLKFQTPLPGYTTVAAHATTCNIWTADYNLLTGSAVTFTTFPAAARQGQTVYVVANAAHTFTDGGDIEVQGNANFTCAAGDIVMVQAKTTTTFQATIFKADGTSTAGGLQIPARQSVIFGSRDSSGLPNFITAGAGLNYNVAATTTPVVMAFAGGYGSAGATDLLARLIADQSNQATLIASNTNYNTADYVSASSVTWGSYLVPPQYGEVFDKTQNSLLNFEAADASTSMIDAFGNTWTATANAQIDTAQFKFGASSLLLDGTGDYIESSNFTSLGSGSWELSCWFRCPSSQTGTLIAAENASGFGAVVYWNHNAGTPKLGFAISSNGTSNDLVNVATATTTLSVNTWYKARVVFDALAGTYRLYLSNNGAAETQESTTSSTTRVCAITKMRLGRSAQLAGDFNGWIDAFRFVRCATTTATATPSASAPAISDYPVHWFDVGGMTMYEATAASASAGTNPTFTARNRLFHSEQDTNGSAVTATRVYSLRGETVVDSAALAVSQEQTLAHNLGVQPRIVVTNLVNITQSQGYSTGDEVYNIAQYNDGTVRFFTTQPDRLNIRQVIDAGQLVIIPKNSTVGGAMAMASWKFRHKLFRGF